MTALTGLVACQARQSTNTPVRDARALLQQDLSAVHELDYSSGAMEHEFSQDNFRLIFGGRTGQDLQRYLDLRLHYYFSSDDLNDARLSPAYFQYTSWSNDPGEDAQMRKDHAQVRASNIGIELWLSGLLDMITPVLTVGDKQISITSGRTGIMEIGPGYRPTATDSKGRTYPLPPEYRISTLLHEARHSDCTGGVTQKNLAAARNAMSYDQFAATFPLACGHFHAKCTSGSFVGLRACDREPWGAYSVQAVFSLEAARSLTATDKRIMEASAADTLSRVLIDTKAMLRGDLGKPNMSSSGLRK